MNTAVNKLEKSMVEVKVTFDNEEWKAAQKKALKKLAASVKLDGFRKGTAPAKLVKAKVGTQAILEEATDVILSDSYAKIFLDNNIQPVGQPEAKIEKISEEELEMTFTAPVAPEVKLGEYKGLEVKKDSVRVTKKEVEEKIKDYQNQFAELVIKEDGAVENGDTAVIDFEGFKDDVAFDGGKAENYPLEIGSGSFIPGFEEQVVGMKVEDAKDIKVTFPEDYQAEDLAGAEVVFKVKVHEIKSKVLPEIDDELAKDVNIDGVETLADLETYVKEQLKVQKDNEADTKFSDDVFKAVVAATPVDVPDAMTESEMQNMISEINQNLSQQGMNMEMFQQMTGKTMDDVKNDIREQAESRVKFQLILAEVVKAENIEISEDEVLDEMKEIATYYGKELDEIKKIFAGQEDRIKDDLASRKAIQLIKDNVK